jgi:hypothetical protein
MPKQLLVQCRSRLANPNEAMSYQLWSMRNTGNLAVVIHPAGSSSSLHEAACWQLLLDFMTLLKRL